MVFFGFFWPLHRSKLKWMNEMCSMSMKLPQRIAEFECFGAEVREGFRLGLLGYRSP